MSRPAGGYVIDGKRVPGASTIGKLIDDPGALIAWANRMGLEGKTLQEARDTAADAGTLIHDAIDAHLHNQPQPEPPDQHRAAVANGLSGFLEWFDQSKLEPLETEKPRVSKRYGFGGTPDLVAQDPAGRIHVIDWKTGKGVRIYPGQILQIRAYGHLVRECDGIPVDRYDIIRFDRETGDFTHVMKRAESLELAWQAFKGCLWLYETAKQIKKIC